jgi:hypothetical protein
MFAGVLLPSEPPEPIPAVPIDLAELADPHLMRLFSLYVAWNDYLDVLRVEAEVEEGNAEADLKLLEATSMAGWGPKDKVTFARAERDTDPEIVIARQRVTTAWSRRKVLMVLCGNMERDASLLSRELSRRIGRAPVEGRYAGWNT